MHPKLKFSEGEKVLCFHGPLIYEAKCLNSSITKDKNVRYFIHYAGWNKNWDEWVPESRVLKYNEANVQRQKEVQKAHAAQPAKAKKASKQGRKSETPVSSAENEGQPATPATVSVMKESESGTPTVPARASYSKDTPSESGSDQPKKKRSRPDVTIESEEQYFSKVEVKVKLPEELKMWLVDDWDVITRQQKLATLPAKLTVDQIFENYLAYKKAIKTHTPAKDSMLLDIVTGLKEYFNVTLGSQLLYKFERPQYSEVLQDFPDTPVSNMYGAVHLLRLLTKLGAMLTYTGLDEKAVQVVLQNVHDLLKYLVSNRSTLFNLQDYANATPEYHRKLQ